MSRAQKTADETAVIYNFSGHKLPQSAFEKLRIKGYKKWVIFNRSIHLNLDDDITQQIRDELDILFKVGNKDGEMPQTVIGDRYYVSSGHSVANLLLYTALTSIFGAPPLVLVMGLNEKTWNEYELKDIIPLKHWKGSWRSEMRQRYTLKDVEVISDEEPHEHLITRRRSSLVTSVN
jgi:hypothetical protein